MPHTRIHHHHHRHHHSKDDDDDEDEAYSKTDKHTPTATTIMHRWRRRLWLLWNHHHHPQQQPMHRLVVIRASLLLFVLMTIIIIIAVTVVLVIIAASISIWIFQHAQCFSREFGTVWMEGPAHEMHRVCPKPLYETLLSHDNHNNNNNNNLHPINNKKPHICITTLTDHHHQSQSPLFSLWLWWWQRWVVKCRDFDAVQQMTWPNRVAYSQQHGYTLIDASPLMDTSRPPAWSKIRAVQALLSSLSSTSSSAPSALSMSSASGYTYNEQAMQSTIKWPSRKCDWVFWMDADTVIMNMTIKLESLLPVNDNIHLIATVDRRFGVNSGAWLIRNSDWSRDFLEEWWNLKAWVRPAGLSLSGDNAAFGYLVQKRIKEQQQQQQQNTTSSSSNRRHQATIQVPARCNFNSFGVFLRQTTKKRLGHSSSTGKSNNIIPESSSSSSISWMQQQEWYLSDQYYHAGDFVAHASGIDQKAAGIELLLNRAAQLEQQQQQQ